MKKLVNENAELNNPCLKEQEMSYACLHKNNFDHSKCEMFFQNYKACKKFWNSVWRDRRAKGIVPHMPPIEEREKIKQEGRNNYSQSKNV